MLYEIALINDNPKTTIFEIHEKKQQIPPNTIEYHAQEMLRNLGIFAEYEQIETVDFNLYKIRPINNKFSKRFVKVITIQKPTKELDEKTYVQLSDKILENLPPAFRPLIQNYAWEMGHANGYQECLASIKEKTDELITSIKMYEKTRTENPKQFFVVEICDGDTFAYFENPDHHRKTERTRPGRRIDPSRLDNECLMNENTYVVIPLY